MKKQRKMMAPKARYFGTPEERKEIELKHAQGVPLTLDECSKVMGLSRSAIKAIESRALAKLKVELQKMFGPNVKLDDLIDTSGGRQCATRFHPED